MTDQPQTVMMFTIATNGYDKIFADWLTTQRNYATRHGYRYVAITASPPESISGANSSWLKIPLILRALERDYAWVFFVDADCRINADAPRIETVSASGKSVYVCRDFSDRINAGVIITKKDPMTVAFFRRLHRLADVPGILLPKQDRNLYEGGHFIWLGKTTRRFPSSTRSGTI